MKLRLLDDSLRLRLDRDEVALFGAGGSVCAMTRFPGGGVLGCVLRAQGTAIAVRFDDRTVTVDVPSDRARGWARDDGAVSIEASIEDSGRSFGLLVEKDFECLEPRAGENQRNRFPNPKARSV